jgi:hypothetical protein
MCLAHQDAYELCGILHRDVSGKNVLMGLNCGVLNDWDLAKRMDSDQGPRPHERTVCARCIFVMADRLKTLSGDLAVHLHASPQETRQSSLAPR